MSFAGWICGLGNPSIGACTAYNYYHEFAVLAVGPLPTPERFR